MTARALLLTAALGLTACKSAPTTTQAPADPTPAQPAAQAAAPLDPATLGTVSGTITFTGTPPTPLKIDTTMDPACGLSDAPAPVAEQVVVKSGKLANVFLYIKSGPPAAINAAFPARPPVVLDQKNCVYTPHVVALGQGSAVEFHNDDPTMHNIHTMAADNPNLDISQGPRGTPQTKPFPKTEIMIPVRCNNHPWMNAFINVSATPFFAVSDAAGRFTIPGLPPGDYTLAAVHEKLGAQTLQLTVAPHATAKADFAFSPAH